MAVARYSFSLTALPTGNVVAVGGVDIMAPSFKSVEIYDPTAGRWSQGPELLKSPREHHSAALLGTGRVLVVGGKNPNVTPLKTVQIFEPTTSTWASSRDLSSVRTLPSILTLETGRALVVGGYD